MVSEQPSIRTIIKRLAGDEAKPITPTTGTMKAAMSRGRIEG